MRICLLSSEHGSCGGIGVSIGRLSELLSREHDVTVVHSYENGGRGELPADRPGLRHVVADLATLPEIAFASPDHERSAAALQAIEQAYGDSPPDYLEVPDYRGHGVVPLQARNSHHRSLRATRVAVRLRGAGGLISIHDGDWATPAQRMVGDLEREALRLCDHVVWPGGDVLELYRRCLDPALFEAATRVRLPFGAAASAPAAHGGGPLRILYAGRLQRAKGVMTLLEACLGLESDDWRLTLIGADTATAPLQQSMRAALELVSDGDDRIEIHDEVPHDALQERFAEHDLLVLPSAFETWPNVAMEAMRAGLPVLANPVGGLREIVADGVTGWWTDGPGRAALGAALERLVTDRAEVGRVRASGAVGARYEALGDEQTVLAEYRELLGRLCGPPAVRRRVNPPPLVTGVVPYFRDSATVGEAVDSLLSQSYPELEVLVVDDGSFAAEDEILLELAARERVRVLFEPNRGETAARNFAAIQAEGTYLAFLDADNTYAADFVARAVAMLEEDPELAYVTCWLRFFDDGDGGMDQVGTGGYAPLGNAVRSDESINSDGDAISVVPRRLLSELGFRYPERAVLTGDWEFYRGLRDAGRYGAVIPELLANYRVRRNSLSRAYSGSGHTISWEEARSRRRGALLEWAPGE